MPFIQHACSAHQHPCSLYTLSHAGSPGYRRPAATQQ